MKEIKGLLFDLDGVIVDTAKYHYLAWKDLANKLDIPFTLKDNERLKGVSRMASFEIILSIGGREMSQEDKEKYCKEKNDVYVSYISRLEKDEILPGVERFLKEALAKGLKTALGSASKNSMLILDRLGITGLFDAIIDGTKVTKAKPDPEVFMKGAEELGLAYDECVVFEDAVAGVEAAHRAGMKAVGIGRREILTKADVVVPGFADMNIGKLTEMLTKGEEA